MSWLRSAIWLLSATLAMAGTASAQGRSEDVTANGFPATLTLPGNVRQPPMALIISGSGPTDRDGNSIWGVSSAYLKKLGDELAAAGIASLRYDKRGVAGSVAVVREEDVTISTYVEDATRVLDWLLARSDVGPIAVVGHSEGGLVALCLARQRPTISRLVLLTTPGRPLGEVLRGQFANQPEPLKGQANAIIAELEAGRKVADVPPALALFFRPSIYPYLMSVFPLDPARSLSDIDQPALVVGGGTDLQIFRADFDALAAARPEVRSLWLPRMNHALVDVADDPADNLAAYADAGRPLSPGLAQTVAAFLQDTR